MCQKSSIRSCGYSFTIGGIERETIHVIPLQTVCPPQPAAGHRGQDDGMTRLHDFRISFHIAFVSAVPATSFLSAFDFISL